VDLDPVRQHRHGSGPVLSARRCPRWVAAAGAEPERMTQDCATGVGRTLGECRVCRLVEWVSLSANASRQDQALVGLGPPWVQMSAHGSFVAGKPEQNWLAGRDLRWSQWTSPRPGWDHDHCAFCQADFAAVKTDHVDFTAGYVTADDNYTWICACCTFTKPSSASTTWNCLLRVRSPQCTALSSRTRHATARSSAI
jgi:hypothetical protein